MIALASFAITILAFVVSQSSSASAPTLSENSSLLLEENVAKPIDRRLLGQSIDMWQTGILTNTASNTYQTVEIATAVRGPGNGLIGDFYDWKDPLGIGDSRRRQGPLTTTLLLPGGRWNPWDEQISPPRSYCTNVNEWENQVGTLDFLRLGRNKNVDLNIIVNTKGIPNWYYWPNITDNLYVTTDLNELKQLASDWVLYTLLPS